MIIIFTEKSHFVKYDEVLVNEFNIVTDFNRDSSFLFLGFKHQRINLLAGRTMRTLRKSILPLKLLNFSLFCVFCAFSHFCRTLCESS